MTVSLAALAVLGCGRVEFELIDGLGALDAAADDGGASDLPAPDAAMGVDAATGDAAAPEDASLDAAAPADASLADAALDARGPDAAQSVDAGADAAADGCRDRVQNGDETGVDCGGAVCPACGSCFDGMQNRDETGIDCGGVACIACGGVLSTPPIAVLTVTPSVGIHDTATPTVFQGDAAGSSDAEDGAALTYEWDWEGDGVYDDTGAVPAGHVYAAPGTYEVVLRVTDSGGLRDHAIFVVVVRASADVIQVTTSFDEDDPGASPGSPGMDGLSLREALKYADTLAGAQSIEVPSGSVIVLDSTLPDVGDVDVIGDGAVIDGTGINGANECIRITTDGNRFFGLELRNCPNGPYTVVGGSNNVFSRGYLHDNNGPARVGGMGNTFSHNRAENNVFAGIVSTGAVQILFNRLSGSVYGVQLEAGADGSVVVGNVVYGNQTGINVTAQTKDVRIVNNTIDSNTNNGMQVNMSASALTFHNNIISSNGFWGLIANSGVFVARSHNDFFENGIGVCSSCVPGPGSQTVDPEYLDAASRDYRLQWQSPLVDVGVETGDDLNGVRAGDFNGLAPDIGAEETAP